MATKTKKHRAALEQLDKGKNYDVAEAVDLVTKVAYAKFDEAVEVHIRLGIDSRKSDQTVRGTTVLPHGTGKTPRVIVFTKGDRIKASEDAGADMAGAEELIQKVKDGWSDFDIAVATPDMMAEIGKSLGRVLGPKMPNPRAGTVAPDPVKAVSELKSGKIQYRADKSGIVHSSIGKVSFGTEKLVDNLKTLLEAVIKAKPAAAKGAYLRSVTLSSTMGPALSVDTAKAGSLGGLK